MYIDEFNLPEVHTNQLTKKEANEMLENYQSTFPDEIYFIEEMSPDEINFTSPQYRQHKKDIVDGWEDFFDKDY